MFTTLLKYHRRLESGKNVSLIDDTFVFSAVITTRFNGKINRSFVIHKDRTLWAQMRF